MCTRIGYVIIMDGCNNKNLTRPGIYIIARCNTYANDNNYCCYYESAAWNSESEKKKHAHMESYNTTQLLSSWVPDCFSISCNLLWNTTSTSYIIMVHTRCVIYLSLSLSLSLLTCTKFSGLNKYPGFYTHVYIYIPSSNLLSCSY